MGDVFAVAGGGAQRSGDGDACNAVDGCADVARTAHPARAARPDNDVRTRGSAATRREQYVNAPVRTAPIATHVPATTTASRAAHPTAVH